MRTIFCFIVGIASLTFAQHSVPFASANNSIELSVANISTVAASNISVEVTNPPTWMRFENHDAKISAIKSKESSTAEFIFSVDKSAPVTTPTEITFAITNTSGEKWSKTLSLQVAPPDHFELFQNYPNPFNPTTTISYQLPATNNVSITIFDITGREVTTLFNGISEAGYHEYKWNASGNASGIYIYQLALTNSDSKKEFYRKKMLVVK